MQVYPPSVEHLLKRKPIATDRVRTRAAIEGKTVLVTGAGGSIGTTLCRLIGQYNPRLLVLLDISEHGLYQIEDDLRSGRCAGIEGEDGFEQDGHPRKMARTQLAPVLGDVSDSKLLDRVFDDSPPDIIFHTAAYKHVAQLERQPQAAIRNNVVGTYNLVCAALEHGSRRLVMLSTDKAVNPASIMGASKRVAELVVMKMSTPDSKMTSVRLGNVLGTQGSVVPRFLDQIKRQSPLTVTHPEASRYFLSPLEAADIVSAAAWLGEGGDILVPDLGEPVRIVDLAKAVIGSFGLEPDGEPAVVFTGLQAGEKVSEELFGRDEPSIRIEDCAITRVLSLKRELCDLCQSIAELEALSRSRNVDALVHLVCRLVPEYTPSGVLLNELRS